jgi:Response regulator of the LytR/AlgR family
MHHSNIPSSTVPENIRSSKLLLIKQGHGIVMVDKNTILFIEKQGKNCIIHTTGNSYKTSTPLIDIEKSLQSPDFFRCHKGFIINVRMVEKILPYADRAYEVYFYNYPLKAPMRREKFEEFYKFIKANF